MPAVNLMDPEYHRRRARDLNAVAAGCALMGEDCERMAAIHSEVAAALFDPGADPFGAIEKLNAVLAESTERLLQANEMIAALCQRDAPPPDQ